MGDTLAALQSVLASRLVLKLPTSMLVRHLFPETAPKQSGTCISPVELMELVTMEKIILQPGICLPCPLLARSSVKWLTGALSELAEAGGLPILSPSRTTLRPQFLLTRPHSLPYKFSELHICT